jgi:hypothetical protein
VVPCHEVIAANKAKAEWRNSACTEPTASGNFSTLLLGGETRAITFTSNGATKLEVPKLTVTITCNKAKATAGAANEIIGGSPGTGKATISFGECSTSATCKAHSPGAAEGTIEAPTNWELVYHSKEAGEKEQSRLDILFKTTKSGSHPFVTIEFSGSGCQGLTTWVVEATGTNTKSGEAGIQGVAGIVCEIREPAETLAVAHEINCPEAPIGRYWHWKGSAVTEGTANLKTLGFEFHQTGIDTIALASGEKYAATGK